MGIMYFTAQINYSILPNHTLKCQSFITSSSAYSFLLKAGTYQIISTHNTNTVRMLRVGQAKCKQP